ncbi:type II toxin-antitoxin system Phd/YefM family antitoxin [Bosea sp. (in: a-proteobacteria)]|uniref:type II toxin-antitoxin system Phd/YefM family antitoxin n=1 Tax=Bosea sp. (in: a-proteobacteria) TaxID=1871050 RepID=UPI003B3A0DD6
MIIVGTFEAKTKFSELLDRVEQGEEVVVTRHGKAVARIVPEAIDGDRASARAREILARRRAIGERLAVSGQLPISAREMWEWIEEGRR